MKTEQMEEVLSKLFSSDKSSETCARVLCVEPFTVSISPIHEGSSFQMAAEFKLLNVKPMRRWK